MPEPSPPRDTPALERYRRQLGLEGFGPEGQAKLGRATVLVAGVGGLGGTVALYLAAAGVGHLILTHAGPLELPDLNRQILMSPGALGRSRVVCARESLLRFNPEVAVEVLDDRLTPATAGSLVARADVAVSCRYNFEERVLLNDACIELARPLVEAAMYGMEAYLTTILPGRTPCLRCLFPEFPAWDPLGFPVLGAVSGTLGCLAAAEALKLLVGTGTLLAGRLLYLDLATMEFRKLRVDRCPRCPVCLRTATNRGARSPRPGPS